jgi:hypothetical protein
MKNTKNIHQEPSNTTLKPDQILNKKKTWFYSQTCIEQESKFKNHRSSLKNHDLIKKVLQTVERNIKSKCTNMYY